MLQFDSIQELGSAQVGGKLSQDICHGYCTHTHKKKTLNNNANDKQLARGNTRQASCGSFPNGKHTLRNVEKLSAGSAESSGFVAGTQTLGHRVLRVGTETHRATFVRFELRWQLHRSTTLHSRC